jgi:hypothetical protein
MKIGKFETTPGIGGIDSIIISIICIFVVLFALVFYGNYDIDNTPINTKNLKIIRGVK